MIRLDVPLKEEDVRKLKLGDNVSITGRIYTGRDAAHKFLVEEMPEEFKDRLNGSCLYHCGPVVRQTENGYEIVAAGPTTSIREEPYEATVIKEFGIRAIIGKGGMGKKTLDACKQNGCVYLSAVGGAAAVLAKSVKKVTNVYKMEFGVPEAIWELDVEGFPAVVTMDANGNSLHDEIEKKSEKEYRKLID